LNAYRKELFVALSEEKRPIKNDIPEKIMEKVSTFPSMPQAGIKLRALLAEKDVSTDDIEGILRHDPGLATNVLRLANSAFFGLRTKVSTLKHAVTLLGIKRFAQIAVSACMSKTMNKAVEGYGLSPGELWLHSIAVSTTAEALAKHKKLAETNDVFTPALLHDMGKLVLGEFVKEEMQKIESLVAKGVPSVIAENMVLGTDHAEIGALILGKWSFPSDIVDTVRWHHNPEVLKVSKMQPEIVYLSNLLCQSSGDSDSADGQIIMPSSVVLDRLGIKLEQCEVLAEKAHSWMKKLSDTLSFY
jgi:putative nucleotidyltransferase with HDIG domain